MYGLHFFLLPHFAEVYMWMKFHALLFFKEEFLTVETIMLLFSQITLTYLAFVH